MKERDRASGLAWGLVLILLGLVFLAVQVFGLPLGWRIESSWPLIVIAAGIGLLLIGLLVRAPGMAIPACIVGGVGGLLYYQNATGDWGSWAYAWSLIPGFVGIGIILHALLGGGKLRENLIGGAWLLLVSAVLFAIFGSFLGPWSFLGITRYWPVLLILIGLLTLIEAFPRRRDKDRGALDKARPAPPDGGAGSGGNGQAEGPGQAAQ